MKKIFLFSLLFLFCSQNNNLYSSEIYEEEIPEETPEETNGDSKADTNSYENEAFEIEEENASDENTYKKDNLYFDYDYNTLAQRERYDDTKIKNIYASLANSIDNDNFRGFEQILKNNPAMNLNNPLVFRQYTLLQYLNKLKHDKHRNEFITLLLQSGASPEGIHKKYPMLDPTGKTQLMLAIINKDKKRVDELLQSPLEVQLIDHQDHQGNTALHYYILKNMGNRFPRIKADDTIKNNNNRTAQDLLDR